MQRVEVTSDGWHVLRRTTFSYRRSDGRQVDQQRETYDRGHGHGATILLYDPDRRTVLSTRQFRYPAYVNGHPVAAYGPSDRVASGGGLPEEGEDIEVREILADEALAMVGDGRIVDGKTVILLQWASLAGLL